jgi:hypothetical protein
MASSRQEFDIAERLVLAALITAVNALVHVFAHEPFTPRMRRMRHDT